MEYDIIICGGGVSGVCAAIGAAREGAKVLVIEQGNCLGGTWTQGLICWIMDSKSKNGLLVNEICQRLEEQGAGRYARGGSFIFEAEAMKRLLDKMCADAGVRVRFHTFVADVLSDGAHVNAVETVSKSGKECFFAKYFVDATGDGDVCAAFGAEYFIGNEEGKTQPMSMFAIVDGIDPAAADFDNAQEYADGTTPKAKENFYAELVRAGFSPSQKEPALYHLYNDMYMMTMNHEYGMQGTDAGDLSEATITAREEINAAVSALRSLGGVWNGIRLVSTAQQIGVREGRRIVGEEIVTREDIVNNKKCENSICDAQTCIDIHALSKDSKQPYDENSDDKLHCYQIPLGAAICKGADNLFMAGRCISGDFYAHASYRVSGNAAAIGENVGRYIAKKVI